MGAWGRDGKAAAIFLLSVSKKILHRMIEMIFFDGSIGMGGEGQQFFYCLFRKIFYIL